MNRKGLFTLIAFVLLSSFVFSQKNIRKENIKLLYGTWKVDSLELGAYNLSPEYEEIVRQKLPEIIENTEVQFKAYKKYYKKGFEGETEGTWDVSADGKYILVKLNGESDTSKTKIISITEEKLVIAPEDENSANSRAFMYKAE